MNSVFTAKLLQNLRNKKGNKGFTLIELLVVVIIIGVLAAVALPNLLGQVAKGRQSEAKNNLGAINRSQQAYRLEKASFGNLADLPIAVSGTNYEYDDVGTVSPVSGAQVAIAQTQYQDDIRDYSAAVNQQADGDFFSIICETDDVDAAANPRDTAAINPGYGTGTNDPTCPANTSQIN